MRADWTVQREDGVALVAVTLGADPPRRVSVEHAGDGPAWPPREAGVSAAGWDDTGWTGVVDGRRALGFATPDAGDPPVAVEWGDPVTDDGDGFDRHPAVPDTEATAGGVIRSFGPTGPPRDAVPIPGTRGSNPPARARTAGPSGVDARTPSVGRVGRVRADGGSGSTADTDPSVGRTPGGGTAPAGGDGGDERPAIEQPNAARDGRAIERDSDERGTGDETEFEAVERRVAAAESLARAETLPELSDAVAAVGGLDGAYALAERLEEDGARLRVTEERAGALRERLAALELPLERLERLA